MQDRLPPQFVATNSRCTLGGVCFLVRTLAFETAPDARRFCILYVLKVPQLGGVKHHHTGVANINKVFK
jgi:hypothetical protein